MTHIQDIRHELCVNFLTHASLALSSGAIEQILNCNAIHRVVKPAKPCTDSIIAQFTQSTQTNRGLIAGIFEAIEGAL